MKICSIRLFDEEYAEVEKYAQARGLTVSEAVRQILEAYVDSHFPPDYTEKEDAD